MRKKKIEVSSKLIKEILDSSFWLETLDTKSFYRRIHDDCDGNVTETINVCFGHDGDAHLTANIAPFKSFRFRTWCGGGSSLRVRNALLILAEAIRLDNEERPQNAPIH